MRSDRAAASFLVTALATAVGLAFLTFAATDLLIRFQPLRSYSYFQILAKTLFELRDQHDELLIVGDSALLTGVDPILVGRKLGLQTRNLAVFANAGSPVYEILLDRYLEKNRKPKAIVFYFSPSSPVLERMNSFEKTWAMIRFGGWASAFNHGATPYDVAALAAKIVLSPVSATLDGLAERLVKAKGFAPSERPALHDCDFDSRTINETYANRQFAPGDFDFFAPLLDKYRKMGIDTYAYVGPVADCDQAFGYFSASYPRAINRLEKRSNSDFVDHTHMTPAGAHANSLHVAEVLACVANGSCGTDRIGAK